MGKVAWSHLKSIYVPTDKTQNYTENHMGISLLLLKTTNVQSIHTHQKQSSVLFCSCIYTRFSIQAWSYLRLSKSERRSWRFSCWRQKSSQISLEVTGQSKASGWDDGNVEVQTNLQTTKVVTHISYVHPATVNSVSDGTEIDQSFALWLFSNLTLTFSH